MDPAECSLATFPVQTLLCVFCWDEGKQVPGACQHIYIYIYTPYFAIYNCFNKKMVEISLTRIWVFFLP